MNPELPLAATPTLAESVALGLMPQRIAASIAGSLGTVGLLLAAIGIYGVTAFTVTRRLREFGIRVALGARRADILRIVLRQGLGLTFAGCAIGVMLAGARRSPVVDFSSGRAGAGPSDVCGRGDAVPAGRPWRLLWPRTPGDGAGSLVGAAVRLSEAALTSHTVGRARFARA